MLSFLAPLFWILGLMALPVAALYLVKDRLTRRRVSTLIFWPEEALRVAESARWHRIRRWVSLLLQLAFLFLVIAALTRPVAGWWGSPVRPVVIVLDTSASMRATESGFSRLSRAQEAAGALVDALGPGCEAVILSTAPVPRILAGWSDSRRELREALLRAQSAEGVSSPNEALALAHNLAAARGAHVWFFSDGVWDGHPVTDALLKDVRLRRVGEEASNAGIARLAARRTNIPGEARVLVEVGWAASGPATPRRISLFKEGVLADAREITPDANRRWSREYVFQSDERFHFEAALDPGDAPDALAWDDRASVGIPAVSRLEAVLVSESDPFLEAALAALPALDVIRLPPDQTPRFGDSGKLWIFQGVLPPADFQAAALVLIDPPEGGFFGERLGKMDTPWLTDQILDRGPTRLADLSQDPIPEATEFHPAAGAEIFASSAGRPLVFGQWNAAPRWIVFGWRPSRTGLTSRAAFPLLLAGLVQDLREDSSAIAVASGHSRALTALKSQAADSEPSLPAATLPPRPLWWWLVVGAVLWCLCEWRTWHRRITE